MKRSPYAPIFYLLEGDYILSGIIGVMYARIGDIGVNKGIGLTTGIEQLGHGWTWF